MPLNQKLKMVKYRGNVCMLYHNISKNKLKKLTTRKFKITHMLHMLLVLDCTGTESGGWDG